jgi:hypothetical protein
MKQKLASLIESYAAARASANITLQEFATAQLSEFLTQVDIVPLTNPSSSPEDEAAPVEAEVA